MKAVKIGICGLGTVGSGVVNVLRRNTELLHDRTGLNIQLIQIGTHRPNPSCHTGGIAITTDIFEVARNPDIDILVELIGGYDTAFDLIKTAIDHGKHIVTANKALIAEHGNELFALAREKGVIITYEAGVAGGIPAIKSLREGLVANRVNWLAGIINGTGNFILTKMDDCGNAFDEVLQEAQALGYAEADPTFDVEGIDAAHKLTILAANAFGTALMFQQTYTEGISTVTPNDLRYARELGYRIKHLGVARRTSKGIELRVHPTLIPQQHLLASVNGVMNSVLIHSDAAGQTMYYGSGAGSEPTASAVIADIVDIARLLEAPQLAVQPLPHNAEHKPPAALAIDEVIARHYLRIRARNRPGVLMQVTEILGQYGINIDALLQKETRGSDGEADVVVLTHEVSEGVLRQSLKAVAELDDVIGNIAHIRVEHLA